MVMDIALTVIFFLLFMMGYFWGTWLSDKRHKEHEAQLEKALRNKCFEVWMKNNKDM